MKSNYNDIIDIILTLINDKKIASEVVIGGSIVPYLITEEEPKNYISDFYILANLKEFDCIKAKLKKLSKIYLFDIVSDSKELIGKDYGFKIKYEDTCLGFFPYLTSNDNFILRTYFYDEKNKNISLKNKLIPNLTPNKIITKTKLGSKNILVMLPEFIFVEKQLSGNYSDFDDEVNKLLNKICDDEVVEIIRSDIEKSEIKINTYKVKNKNSFLNILLFLVLIIIFLVVFVCIKK